MWEPATFESASASAPVPRAGYTYRGLGLYLATKASPKGRRPARWCLIHLNSGLAVAWVDGAVGEAFPVASALAECADWSFDGPSGWRNVDPELPDKVRVIMAANPTATRNAGGAAGNDEVSREILTARTA